MEWEGSWSSLQLLPLQKAHQQDTKPGATSNTRRQCYGRTGSDDATICTINAVLLISLDWNWELNVPIFIFLCDPTPFVMS